MSNELAKEIHRYYECERKQKRLSVSQGYLIAIERADEVWEIIVKENALEELIDRIGLSKAQAYYILNLTIKSFIELDRKKIEKEIQLIESWLEQYEMG